MSLRLRIFLSHTIVIAVALTAAFFTLAVLLRNVPERQRQVQLATRAEDMADFGRLLQANENNPERARERLARFATARRVRVLVTDASGKVTEDSAIAAAAAMTGKQLDLSQKLDAPAVASQASIGDFRDATNRRFLFAAVPAQQNRTWLVLAQLAAEPRLTLGAIDDLTTSLARAAILGLALAAIVAIVVARSISQPIQRVTQAARAMANGDLKQRVAPGGPAEIRQLAGDFNSMAARVQSAQQTERDFVANVSHELKTPLTSIQGFAQAIREGAATDTSHAAGIIQDEAARLQRLVNSLLDSARIESGAIQMVFRPVQVEEIAGACVGRFAQRASAAQIALTAEHDLNLPAISADGDRLAQVFTNLIDNALSHSAAGGRVSVECRTAGANIEINVTDRGAGIAPNDLPHIFDRFYQADKSRSGSSGAGLGLAISRQIVEAHGGAISAQSVPGIGTRMLVSLPLTAREMR